MALGCNRAATAKRSVATAAPTSHATTRVKSAPVENADSHAIPNPGKLHVFGDWIAGCDNSGGCSATSLLSHEDGPEDDILSMRVDVAATGELGVGVNLQYAVTPGQPFTRAQILVDRQRFTVDGDLWVDELTGPKAAAFLHRRFGGRPIAIADRHGKRVGFVSSKGFERAIAYVEKARRSYRGKALPVPIIRSPHRKGAQPLPVSAAQLRQVRQDLRRWDRDCDDQDYARTEALDDKHTLLLVACQTWGRGDSEDAVYVARRTPGGIEIQPAKLDYAPRKVRSRVTLLDNARTGEDDDEFGTKVLSSTLRGDIAEDPHVYGPMLDYVWDGDGLRLVRLSEASSDKLYYYDEIVTWWAKVVPR